MAPDDYRDTLRMFRCEAAGCGALLLLCTHCDHGDRYCEETCAQRERVRRHRESNRRYAMTFRDPLDDPDIADADADDIDF